MNDRVGDKWPSPWHRGIQAHTNTHIHTFMCSTHIHMHTHTFAYTHTHTRMHAHTQVPPQGKGSMYLRPLLLGTGAILGLGPAPEYTFTIYAAAVGAYFKVCFFGLMWVGVCFFISSPASASTT